MGAVFDASFFGGLLYLNVPAIVSQWIASFVGSTHNHLWHHFKVFEHNQNFRRTYSWSLLLTGILIILSGFVLSGLEFWLHNIWLSKAITLGLTALISFIVRKVFIFTKSEKNEIENKIVE